MRYQRSTAYAYTPGITPGVKWLLVANTAVFVLRYFARVFGGGSLFQDFMLWPRAVWQEPLLSFWQPFTYLFLHADFWHILFNMLALWMFGTDLERDWGTPFFLKYYFLCGVGAGLCVVFADAVLRGPGYPTIGSSGAIYGILLAFGVLYPDRIVLFSFLFPIKAKYFVMIIGAIAFMSSLGASGGGVSHVAHLGGMIFGYVYLRRRRLRVRLDLAGALQRQYQAWKLRRAKRKFEVYLRQHRSGRDPHVH